MNAKHWTWIWIGAACALLWMPDVALASSSDAINELSTGVQRIEATMTGPVVKAVAVIALVVGGLMLAFGGELGAIGKTLAQTFLAIGLAGGAASIVTKVFGINGAALPAATACVCPAEPDSDTSIHTTTKAEP